MDEHRESELGGGNADTEKKKGLAHSRTFVSRFAPKKKYQQASATGIADDSGTDEEVLEESYPPEDPLSSEREDENSTSDVGKTHETGVDSGTESADLTADTSTEPDMSEEEGEHSTLEQNNNEPIVSPIRRAPTKTTVEGPNTSLRNRLPSLPHTILGIVVVGLFVASAVIGFTDEGEINIQNVVSERERDISERRARGEDVLEESSAVHGQRSTDRPRLRPAAARSEPVVPEDSDELSATSTATSTATTNATTTVTDVAGNATSMVATSTDPREEVDDTQDEPDDMSPEFSEELEEEESDQVSDESQEESTETLDE